MAAVIASPSSYVTAGWFDGRPCLLSIHKVAPGSRACTINVVPQWPFADGRTAVAIAGGTTFADAVMTALEMTDHPNSSKLRVDWYRMWGGNERLGWQSTFIASSFTLRLWHVAVRRQLMGAGHAVPR